MKYLIDGYNLIFECGLHGKQITGQSVAAARNRLLSEISSCLCESQHASVTVVFDASRKMVREELDEEFFGNIRVLYSIRFDDADEMIEHLIGQHSAPGQLTVVSSDHRLHKAALRRKAMPVDSGDWYDLLLEGRLRSEAVTDAPTVNLDSTAQTSSDNPSDPLLSPDELEQFQKDVDDFGV